MRPFSSGSIRQVQGLPCNPPQRSCRTRGRPLLRAAPQARRSSLDERLEQPVTTARVAALEQLYLAAPIAPDQLAAQQSAAAAKKEQQLQPEDLQQQQQAHHMRHDELCGKMVCVEHSIDNVAGNLAECENKPAAGSSLGRLLDMLPLSKRTRGIVMLNVLVMLVATNWVVVKDVGANFDPFGFAFLRFAVAAAAFAPFMKAAAKDKRILTAGLELGVWTAAGYITQSAGLLTTDASRASFLSTFTVLVVPFLAGISGKGVTRVTWASCLAALVGVGLLEQGGAPAGIGDIWSFLSAVAFGVQVFRTEHHARTLGNGSNLPLMSVVLTTTMAFAAVAAGVAHPDALWDMLRHPAIAQTWLTADAFPWQQVLYCGLLTTDLALMMEIFALQDVSSVDAAIIYTLEPVLGAALAWVLLGERLGTTGMVGAVLILASSLATQVLGGGEVKEGQQALATKDD